jgi:hypothetical protein
MIQIIERIPAERTTIYKIRKVFEHPNAEEHLALERMAIFGACETTQRWPRPATEAQPESAPKKQGGRAQKASPHSEVCFGPPELVRCRDGIPSCRQLSLAITRTQ